jgi:hypothetical protein
MLLTLLLTLTLAAPVPKTEPADWKAALKDREFDYPSQPHRALDSMVAAENAGLTAAFVIEEGHASGAFVLAKRGGPQVKVRAHRMTAAVVRGDSLYVTDYDTISSGCTVVAYNLATGKKAWAKELEGIGPIDHSKYRNYVAMSVERHPKIKDAFALVVTGWEAQGAYVEVIDLMTGEQLANKKFESPGLPRP